MQRGAGEGAGAWFYGLLRPFFMPCGQWMGLMGLMGLMGGCGGCAAARTPPGCTGRFLELVLRSLLQLVLRLLLQLVLQISVFRTTEKAVFFAQRECRLAFFIQKGIAVFVC